MKFVEMLAERFHPVLKSADFKRSAQHWHKPNHEVVQVVNLQQSRWGNWSYVNCGIYLRQSDNFEKPKEYECDVRFRLEDVTPGELGNLVYGKFHELMSEQPRQPTESDASAVTEALVKYGLPFLAQFQSIENIKILSAQTRDAQSIATNFARQLSEKIYKIHVATS